MSKRALPFAPELVQAFWRLALNGNSAWVKYYSKRGSWRGSNMKQSSVGYHRPSGRDTSAEAGKPYFYTVDFVEQHRLGFGFWSRTTRAGQTTYRFAAHDVEPMLQFPKKHVDRSPSSQAKRRTRKSAQKLYQAWVELAQLHSEILWVLLVESSRGHFHVWALFEQPLTQQAHDELLAEVYQRTGPILDLDKDTSRGKRGLGDQFRAPWSYKRCRQAKPIASWIRDEQRAIELGAAAIPDRPPHQRAHHTTDAELLADLVSRYPIHQPGQRNNQLARAVGSLIGRGYADATITQVIGQWLSTYQDKMSTDLEEALSLIQPCIDRTRNNPDFHPAHSPQDYDKLFQDWQLTARQENFLNARLGYQANRPYLWLPPPAGQRRMPQGMQGRGSHEGPNPCHYLHAHVDSDISCAPRSTPASDDMSSSPESEDGLDELLKEVSAELPSKVIRKSPIHNYSGPLLCERDHDRWFVEALVLQSQQKLEEGMGSQVTMTHGQLNQIIDSRHGHLLDPQQLQRLKVRYVTFCKRGTTEWQQAQRFELLKEVEKGVFGKPSRYQITGLGYGLVLGEEARLEWESWCRQLKFDPAGRQRKRRANRRRRYFGVYGGEALD